MTKKHDKRHCSSSDDNKRRPYVVCKESSSSSSCDSSTSSSVTCISMSDICGCEERCRDDKKDCKKGSKCRNLDYCTYDYGFKNACGGAGGCNGGGCGNICLGCNRKVCKDKSAGSAASDIGSKTKKCHSSSSDSSSSKSKCKSKSIASEMAAEGWDCKKGKVESIAQEQHAKVETTDKSCMTFKGKKFLVTFGTKKGHRWANYNEFDDVIYINKKQSPILHLCRGYNYFFEVEQEGDEHLFFLTESPVGGPKAEKLRGSFDPIAHGCVCYQVDKNTPRFFFYQDKKTEFAGGLVLVHNEGERV